MVDDTHIALVMADVSGKGVPAALFMAISKVLLKTSVQAGRGPGETLERVNNQLLEGNNTGLFVTVWLAVIDITTGKGVAANAGHMHPVLNRNGDDGATELLPALKDAIDAFVGDAPQFDDITMLAFEFRGIE